MKGNISVVINTLDEEKNITQAMRSAQWADEILVCDMHSADKTVSIAKKLGARVIYHKKMGYVEPARNFAISKALNEWVLILDADEEIPSTLAEKLRNISSKDEVDAVWIPRQNIIFGKWMIASLWWPDFNVRFFKKGTVKWKDAIHSNPEISGRQTYLSEDKSLAIIHHHYQSLSQFINRMNRYTDIQSQEISQGGYKFSWVDLISKPTNEFLSRFFAGSGFKDGLHGLALSLLQAFAFFILYLKLWEKEGFKEQEITLYDLENEVKKSGKDISYWFNFVALSSNKFKRLTQKVSHVFLNKF